MMPFAAATWMASRFTAFPSEIQLAHSESPEDLPDGTKMSFRGSPDPVLSAGLCQSRQLVDFI